MGAGRLPFWVILPVINKAAFPPKKARVASGDSELCLSHRWLHRQPELNPGLLLVECLAQSPQPPSPKLPERPGGGGAAMLGIMIPDRAHLSGCALFSDAELPQVVLQVQINIPRF
jgi:hypothetical protein